MDLFLEATDDLFDPIDWREHYACPCPISRRHLRQLQGEDENSTWEIVFTCITMVGMFAALLSDKLGADSVMLAALTLFMAAEIISIKEGLAGFANEGLLTVLVLFVVAEGISRTGALDWYMGKLLGRPNSSTSAQLRLMAPIAVVSAFLNNTPVVAVMIPIVQKWSKTIGISRQQLMIPLSFATILGGTCTLIGTSTNLVVKGLLDERYGTDGDVSIGLFDLAKYGVPVAIAGMTYILLASPFLLPGSSTGRKGNGDNQLENSEDILLRARLTQWSPAAGRTVKRSGLRDTGGIYLVSVQRFVTGNVHRAVGQDFVLNVGDILYFTGLIEGMGEFCQEHGLEMISNEVEPASPEPGSERLATVATLSTPRDDLEANIPCEVGETKESLVHADTAECLRSINHMADTIRGIVSGEPAGTTAPTRRRHSLRSTPIDPAKVVVTNDREMVVVGVEAIDRQGLLLDISKGLLRLNLQFHHTEAAVVDGRSLSIWRCEPTSGTDLADLEEIWTVLNALLENTSGVEAIKRRGLRVIRSRVTPVSRLLGKTATDANFRGVYKSAIVAVQRAGKNINSSLATVVFQAEDILILQSSDDSPLLQLKPPDNFYKENPSSNSDGEVTHNQMTSEEQALLRDLEVLLQDEKGNPAGGQPSREFLTAMTIAHNGGLTGTNAVQAGLSKLPGVVLLNIDRPNHMEHGISKKPKVSVLTMQPEAGDLDAQVEHLEESLHSICGNEQQTFTSITIEEKLQAGDILWFAGSASALGDLRKIPGLSSHESEEVEKINEKVFDRRLVQAVVARQGPLVGKTVKEVQFRTRYGAAVIAVHREGKRIYDHPGNILLQAGDVLLLEAGSTFIGKSAEFERSFALFSEVKDSAPPRLSLLFPALLITATMLAVFTAGVASLLVCGLVASMLMIAIGILSEQEARDAIKWDVYVTIGSAFGIGTALVNSGVAKAGASFLVDVGEAMGIGDAGLIGAVYLATFLISNVVTNNAAAALVFPIALDAAEETGTDKVLMSFCLMLGASASFMTPFGYQTNLMVYGPGGYTSKDFLLIGTPMQLVLWVLTTAFLTFPSWWLSWLITSAVLLAVVAFNVFRSNGRHERPQKAGNHEL